MKRSLLEFVIGHSRTSFLEMIRDESKWNKTICAKRLAIITEKCRTPLETAIVGCSRGDEDMDDDHSGKSSMISV